MTPFPFKEWLAIGIWMVSIVFFAWIPQQDDFHLILPLILFSFGSYAFICMNVTSVKVQYILVAAIVTRILIIPSFPNLSDDIYRFIWDGRLWSIGLNPYLQLPSEIVGKYNPLNQELFDKLNSQEYYSIYPPIPQFIFWCSSSISSGSIIVASMAMKFFHFLFDIGSILIICNLLKKFNLSKRRILLYALNPLIIIELIGNLHHEGIVIFFMLLVIWSLSHKKIILTGAAMAGAIATKILPLLFCPLLFFYLKGRQRWIFFSVTVFICLLLFFPVVSEPQIFENILSSADLYLRKFEFNASVYYLYRSLGYLIYGYNLIHILGPTLMLLTAVSIFYIAYFKGSRISQDSQVILLLLLTYCSYIFFSITVHPWYIAILIPLSIFTKYRTPIVWSGLIMLTYINYSFIPYHEVLSVVFIEYSIVLAFFIYEIRDLIQKRPLSL